MPIFLKVQIFSGWNKTDGHLWLTVFMRHHKKQLNISKTMKLVVDFRKWQ